ncbi:MAG: DUF2779 domain-containing protein [Verrucomicrobiales bacterium]
MRHLSKSKIIAYRQCPKRLWLEVHRRELRDDSGSEAAFAIGHEVGNVARRVYDENGDGVFLDLDEIGFADSFARSAELLAEGRIPVFEAGFKGGGGLAFADIMLPDPSSGSPRWRMIEVKSSTSVKDYHREDVAVQNCIAAEAGVEIASIALAHIDNQFVYPGGGDYRGLFHEEDLTEEARARQEEAATWLAEAQKVAAREEEPAIDTGPHCSDPFGCPFLAYCEQGKEAVEYPLTSLPRFGAAKREALEAKGIHDIRDVPDGELNEVQLRVKEASISGEAWFDAAGAADDLAGDGFPAWFLDFETVNFTVPIWAGSRPYQQIPFQYSLHRFEESGELNHEAFLDLGGGDPGDSFAASLVEHCGDSGPVYVYNAAFERRIMRDLAEHFPQHAVGLKGIIDRLVDLLPIARNRYYHPDQHGSWSIKAVLPCLVPDLTYGHLKGVSDGEMASNTFREAMAEETTPSLTRASALVMGSICPGIPG